MENFKDHQQFIPPQEISKAERSEKEITPEQKEILESAEKFVNYLTSRWPQVDEGKKMMNYYLSGSLAIMLLSKAESFTEIDENQMDGLNETQTRTVPEKTQQILASFARPIGDLDYVPTDFYNDKRESVRNSYKKVSDEEYQRLRSQYLWKGGGGPSFEEIPEDAKKCFQLEKSQLKIMCDPVESYGAKRAAKIKVGEKEYYIARPDTIFAYKVLHLIQGYGQKPEKFNEDFGKLLLAMEEIYSEDELLQITNQILVDYENAMEALHHRLYEGDDTKPYEPKIPAFIKNVLANPKIAPEIKDIVEKAKKEFGV